MSAMTAGTPHRRRRNAARRPHPHLSVVTSNPAAAAPGGQPGRRAGAPGTAGEGVSSGNPARRPAAPGTGTGRHRRPEPGAGSPGRTRGNGAPAASSCARPDAAAGGLMRPVAGRRPVPATGQPTAGHPQAQDLIPGSATVSRRPAPAVRAGGRPYGRTRLTRRGRVVVAALVVAGALLLVALAWLAGAANAQAAHVGGGPGHPYRNLTAVVVRPGETLWSIAQRTQPGADPRAVVQEIIDVNALSSSAVTAGERLWVPKR